MDRGIYLSTYLLLLCADCEEVWRSRQPLLLSLFLGGPNQQRGRWSPKNACGLIWTERNREENRETPIDKQIVWLPFREGRRRRSLPHTREAARVSLGSAEALPRLLHLLLRLLVPPAQEPPDC